jgi:putative transposase
MNNTLILTDKAVMQMSQEILQEHIELQANGYKVQTTDLWRVLLGVAADQGTIESVCNKLHEGPQAESIRQYIKVQLRAEDLPQLEKELNEALVAKLPKHLWRREQDVAIDFHDQPYYGKRPQEEALWVGDRAKASTTRFYRIATAYVLRKNMRYTLGVCFVGPGMSVEKVLQELSHHLKKLAIPLHCLLLDRGFAAIGAQLFLEREALPAIIACPIRGKKGGTRALCTGRKSYRTQYIFDGRKGRKRVAELAVCRVFTTARRTGRLQRKVDWQIFVLINVDFSPKQVRRLYRRRFAIESSYRSANQVRGRTTSPNPAYRFLLMTLGLILANIWTYLRWWYTQRARSGGRWLEVKEFQLNRFAEFILQALQHHYGYIREIKAVVAPI